MNEPIIKAIVLLGCAIGLFIIRAVLKRHYADHRANPAAPEHELRNTEVTIIMCAIVSGVAVVMSAFFFARGLGWV